MGFLSIVREKTGWTARCCHTWRPTEISLQPLSEAAQKWRCIFVNKHLWLDSENEIIFSELSTCKQIIGAILCRQSCLVCPSLPVRVQWCWGGRERETYRERESCLLHFRNTFMEILSISLLHFNNIVAGRHVPILHDSTFSYFSSLCEIQTAETPDLHSGNKKINCSWCCMIIELQNYIPSAVTA